jgi:hypothetical protein
MVATRHRADRGILTCFLLQPAPCFPARASYAPPSILRQALSLISALRGSRHQALVSLVPVQPALALAPAELHAATFSCGK